MKSMSQFKIASDHKPSWVINQQPSVSKTCEKSLLDCSYTRNSDGRRKQQYFGRRPQGPGRLRSALSAQHQFRVQPNLEPQVLILRIESKQLPMRSEDLLSFCFLGGLEVYDIQRTPTMS